MRRLLRFVSAVALGIVLLAVPESAAAVAPVGLSVGNGRLYSYGNNPTNWFVDGRVYNPTPGHVTDVVVHVTFKNASNVVLGTADVPAGCHVMEDGDWKPFVSQVIRPAGTSIVSYTAQGTPTSALAHVVSAAGDVHVHDFTTARRWEGTKVNGPAHLGSVIVAGEEWIQPPQFYAGLVDLYDVDRVIEPDATDGIVCWEWKPTVGTHYLSYLDYEWVTVSPSLVWRFFNTRTGTHFYTADPAEKSDVINNLGWLFAYEGEAYSVNTGSPSNMRPLYRFYNTRAGTHFYTMDEGEKANVIANLSTIYSYDGPAYNVSSFPWYSRPVYRFYNARAGVHFYTADAAERDNVINNYGNVYAYEGPAFYLAY